jgi:hypothetical protein
MRVIGSGCFYYDGFQTYSHPPFSEVSGRVLYANGQPARGIVVRVDRAFGLGQIRPRRTRTGAFVRPGFQLAAIELLRRYSILYLTPIGRIEPGITPAFPFPKAPPNF